MRLRQLAKLEEIKIKEEQGNLDSERKDLEKILGSKNRLKTLIKKELKADAEIYGDDPDGWDTDGDGMPDGWEVANNLDPTSNSGDDGTSGDPDGDGLINLYE